MGLILKLNSSQSYPSKALHPAHVCPCCRTTPFPELDKRLYEFYRKRREAGLPVNYDHLANHIVELKPEFNLPDTFKGKGI
jgi:hypothetical protein